MAKNRPPSSEPTLSATRSADSPADGRIYFIRNERVMLDSDLAAVYGVLTKVLNQAVDRNARRFPPVFAFRLTSGEWENLKSQMVTSSSAWGGRRKLPRVFTEHGVVMLAAVLNSAQAIAASLQVVQAFVRLRCLLDANRELARRIDELNAKLEKKTGEDAVRFQAIFQELKRLALGYDAVDAKPKGRIGFKTNQERGAESGGQTGKAKGFKGRVPIGHGQVSLGARGRQGRLAKHESASRSVPRRMEL